MKAKLIPILFGAVLSVSQASGQDNRVSPKPHMDTTLTMPGSASAPAPITTGIGVAIGSSGVSIYFPIIAGRDFRIEPELGPFSKLGIGLLYAHPLRGSNKVYFGPRLARFASPIKNLFSSDVGSEPLRVGYIVGACAGLEHGSSHFTISFELGLGYAKDWSYNEKIYPPGMGPTISHDVIIRGGLLGDARLSLRAYL
ncbi:MAG: hypothetical protein ACP5ON_03885 [Bacteroidota bacterium]